MGGWGSGRYRGRCTECDHQYGIDLTWMRRQGLLQNGRQGQITWSSNGERTGWIQYAVLSNGLRLIYRARTGAEAWEDIDEIIPFTTTVPHLGGSRFWFTCPSCRCRCRIVYGGRRFRCRKCHGFVYESQHERPAFRAATQMHKLRDRLGQRDSLDEPFPDKPKGMHWKTYARLAARDEALHDVWRGAMMRYLGFKA